MTPDTAFWHAITALITTDAIMIDRPKGSSHPRSKELLYPLDYGYLENKVSSDGGGMDVWLGSLNSVMNKEGGKTLTGILCTFDTLKRDAEIKLLIGCTEEDIQIIQEFHREMYTLYIRNPMVTKT
jgi:inorganic pyrophosphatase